jgi:hypothetical protein
MDEKSIVNRSFSNWLTFGDSRIYSYMIVYRRPGLAALSLIIALVIIALMAFLAVRYFAGPGGSETGGRDSPIARARDVQCLAQIKKIEMQVQIYSVRHGQYPDNLEVLEDLVPEDLCCPVTQSPYQYDPQSGRVSCPDHIR